MIYKKVQAALNICEHKTLPSDPGTVGETLEAVGFSATSEKMNRMNDSSNLKVVCYFLFFHNKKISLKSRPWKLNEYYLKINED